MPGASAHEVRALERNPGARLEPYDWQWRPSFGLKPRIEDSMDLPLSTR